jgi:hypothetical protein
MNTQPDIRGIQNILLPHFLEIIQSAPAYGFCGITITFHDGRPVKVEKNVGISIKPDGQDNGI